MVAKDEAMADDEGQRSAPSRGARNTTRHLLVGTAICLATMLVFAAFWNLLPESIPVQLTAGGATANHLPRPVVVFGFPLVLATLNLVSTARLRERGESRVFGYYVVPVLAVVLCAATIIMSLR